MLILSAFFWSGNFVLSRGMHTEIAPISLSFWRWAVALLILLPFALKPLKQDRQIIQKNLKFIIFQGIISITGFNTLIYIALQSTTAINASLVNSAIPVMIAVISQAVYRERLTGFQSMGILLSLFGVLYLMSKGNLDILLAMEFNRGDIVVLFATLLWATYSVNLKKAPRELHQISYLASINIVGVLALVPFFLHDIALGKTFPITLPNVMTIGYVALFASVLAFLFWNGAIKKLGANKAGPFIHLMPVFSTILAVLFLDEKLMHYHLTGIIFVFAGIFITSFKFSMVFRNNVAGAGSPIKGQVK
ncbi:DMT family transporter [Desulfosarcina alkanivorans]|nr:DMT family transporter [Desulfosarcina alkanivorans]